MAISGPLPQYQQLKERLEAYETEKSQNWVFQGWLSSVKDYLAGEFKRLNPADETAIKDSVQAFCRTLWTVASAANMTEGSSLRSELLAICSVPWTEGPPLFDVSPFVSDAESDGEGETHAQRSAPDLYDPATYQAEPAQAAQADAELPAATESEPTTGPAPTVATATTDTEQDSHSTTPFFDRACEAVQDKLRTIRLKREKKEMQAIVDRHIAGNPDRHAATTRPSNT